MEHEIRVPIDSQTGALIDALSATWHCSYGDVLARCVEQAARGQAGHTRLLRVVLLHHDDARRTAAAARLKHQAEHGYDRL